MPAPVARLATLPNALAVRADSGINSVAALALLGDRWDSTRLMSECIADEVVDDDQVVQRASDIALRLAGFPNGAAMATDHPLVA